MAKLRAAVVGVGYLGNFHAQKYKSLENVELVGVCDQQLDRAQSVGETLNTKVFSDYKQLVGKVDAVTIAASTTAHYDLAKFFLSNGIHVLVEKPMTSTVSQAEELVELADKKGLKLQVGHVERFNAALQAVREKLHNPLFIEVHRLAPFKPRGVDVSIVLDLMIHDIDVILSMVRSPLKSVSAAGTPVMTKQIDIANARLEFENGTIANLTSSRVSRNSTRKFRVFLKNQYMSLDFATGEVVLLTKVGEWKHDNIPIENESWNLEKGDALLAEVKSFVDSIAMNKRPEVSGADGLVAMRIAEAVSRDIDQRLTHFSGKVADLM